jgi:glycerophosphoryl diester phosphodiesterase
VVERPALLEVTAFGAAALAGLAVGFWDGESALPGGGRAVTRFEPRMGEDQARGALRGLAARGGEVAGLGGGVSRPPLVIAHPRSSGERPENTLPAYALAVEQRADMIEIDLHRTRDGEIVIAARRAPARAARWARDRGVHVRRRARARDGELRVPVARRGARRIRRADSFQPRDQGRRQGAYPGIEAETLAALAARGLGRTILFSSFDDGVLQRLREADPRARIGVLVSGRARRRWLERCAAVGGRGGPLLEGARHRARGGGRALARPRVYVYTVDDPAEMRFAARSRLRWAVHQLPVPDASAGRRLIPQGCAVRAPNGARFYDQSACDSLDESN